MKKKKIEKKSERIHTIIAINSQQEHKQQLHLIISSVMYMLEKKMARGNIASC